MAIATDTEWEIRTTGAGTNGGGFKDLNPGTSVDYSQQNSAQLALTDIASNGAGTGISSTTGGFTAAMEGNCMYISGTGFTTGWYQITGYTDTNNITIDRSCGASASGGTGNVGGAWKFNSTNNNTFFGAVNKANYDICHIEAGTYSTADLGTTGITIASHWLRWKGYNTTRGDEPEGTNRPLLDFGNNAGGITWSGTYAQILHLQINQSYTTSSNMLYISGGNPTLRNIKATRSGVNAYAVRMAADYGRVIQGEITSALGTAIRFEKSLGSLLFSYIHDSVNGVLYSGTGYGLTVAHCIIDTCSTIGIQFNYGCRAMNNVIYNCGTGITTATLYMIVLNNIIHTCTTGVYGPKDAYSDFNSFYNNTTDRSNGILAGPNDISADPLLNDPANADFSLQATSPAFNTAAKLGSIVGLP